MVENVNESSPASENAPVNSLPPQAFSRPRALGWFTLLLLLAALVWFCYWYFDLQYYESTDDAYANGNLIKVNSVISGAVVSFFADDTDLVKEGQLLVELDKLNYQLAYEKELATLASVTLQVRELYNDVQTKRANVENKRAIFKRAEFDYESRKQLSQTLPQAIAQEDFVHSNQNFQAAQFALLQAESQLEAALALAGNTPPENHPLIEQQKGNILTAFYQLEHCSIYAPATGYIAQRAVNVGEWVTPSVHLMTLIPVDYVWVDANFKETQLTKMRVGQPATVAFDLYGSKVQYTGKVLGVALGTGSIFSLIPPQNATGNWIKIVQRLPVRISLDPEQVKKFPVRLGISAEVEVDIRDQTLPFLANVPHTQPVAKTSVFDLHLEEVKQLMDKIVQENLQQKVL